MNYPLAQALRHRLAVSFGQSCDVTDLRRLTGGASRETWAFTVTTHDGRVRELILRRDPAELEDPVRMTLEASAFCEASRVGVPVPQILDRSDSTPVTGLGGSYLIMSKLDGEALPQRLLRDTQYVDVRARLPYELGRTLARIHQCDPDRIPALPHGDQLDLLFESYIETEPLPALDLAFGWLRAHRPKVGRTTVVHGDFRNGNVLVDGGGICGVLDWELVHLGDPMEDLGWLCTKAWRFGSVEPVGGFGSRQELFRGYIDECGVTPDEESVHWWELYGSLRWAVICRMQSTRASSGDKSNALELLAIGRRLAECEHDLLELLGLSSVSITSTADSALPPVEDILFGSPSVVELLHAVRDFIDDVCADAEPKNKYLGKVAANVLGISAREIAIGDAARRMHRKRLAAIGYESESQLALALRSGSASGTEGPIVDLIVRAVADRLAVANPHY